jgi:hypothetical protein
LEAFVNLRLHALADECDHLAALLGQTPGLVVVSRRGPYPDRPPSVLVRVYLEVRVATDQPNDPVADQAGGLAAPAAADASPARQRRRGGRR